MTYYYNKGIIKIKKLKGVSLINLFKHRNLALGCAGFLITLFLCYKISVISMIIVASVCLIVLFTLWIVYSKTKNNRLLNILIKYTPLLILIILAILISLTVFVNGRKNLEYCDYNEHTVTAKVESVVYKSSYHSTYIVSIDTIDDDEKNLKILFAADTDSLLENDEFEASVIFSPLHQGRLGFDSTNYYLSKNIILLGNCVEIISSHNGDMDFVDYFKSVNKYLDDIFKKTLNSDTYPIVSALFLGNRGLISDSLDRDYSRCGIVHILSLGGMHISIIIGMLGFAISKLNITKNLQILLMTLTVLCFIGITGFSETALRAGIMQIIFYFIFLIWDKADSITSLFVAVTVICVFAPYLIFSISLILSFFAMLGCICSAKLLYKSAFFNKIRSKIICFVILTTVTTLGVTFMALPIVFIYFGAVSLASIPANLLIVPLLNILIYLAPCILILSPFPYICDFPVFICETICEITTTLCSHISSIKGVLLYIKGDIQHLGIALIFISCLAILILPKDKIKHSLVSLLVSVLVFALGTVAVIADRNESSYITSYSSATNDAVLVESNNALTYFDISNHSSLLYPHNLSLYIGYTEIENYVSLSYSSSLPRHLDILTDNTIVRQVYLPEPCTENEIEYFNKCIDILDRKKIKHGLLNELTLYEVDITLLEDTHIGRSTKRCVVLSLLINNVRYTYLGASSFELSTHVPAQLVHASDIIAFGDYGPAFETKYSYSAPNCKYMIFMGNSIKYAKTDMITCNVILLGDPFTIRIKK